MITPTRAQKKIKNIRSTDIKKTGLYLMKVFRILLIGLVLTSCDKGESEIVIVPRNYIGRILIIYGQANGISPLYQGGKRVYKIPSNGILKTKFAPNPGWIGLPEFYYNEISPKNRIPFKLNPRLLPVDSIVAHGGTAGSVQNGNQRVRFLEYYVGNKVQINTAYDQAQKSDIINLLQ